MTLLRESLIKARVETVGQRGSQSLVLPDTSFLLRPSPPFYYASEAFGTSRAWRWQKTDLMFHGPKLIWRGSVIGEIIPKRLPRSILDQLMEFTDLALAQRSRSARLDASCQFWQDDWLYAYNGAGNLEYYYGTETVFWRDALVVEAHCAGASCN